MCKFPLSPLPPPIRSKQLLSVHMGRVLSLLVTVISLLLFDRSGSVWFAVVVDDGVVVVVVFFRQFAAAFFQPLYSGVSVYMPTLETMLPVSFLSTDTLTV